MDFNSILNVLLQNQAIQKANVPLIRMSGMPQVRVGVVGQVKAITHSFVQFESMYVIVHAIV